MQESSLKAGKWGGAIRLGVLLLEVTAAAAISTNLSGIWVLDSASSDLGQCWKVESMMLKVEYTATHVIDVELVNDESGGRLLKREFTTFKRVGNTIQLRAERQPNQFPAQSEQWTLQRLLRNVYIFGRIGDVTGLSTV
jgi:hypothetical protein